MAIAAGAWNDLGASLQKIASEGGNPEAKRLFAFEGVAGVGAS